MECPQPHTILAAVDGSENSRRAMDYLARWAACNPAARVVLVHVVKEPGRDVLPDKDERDVYVGKKRKAGEKMVDEAAQRLESMGVPEDQVSRKMVACKPPATVADALLKEKKEGGYDTMVLGRRGMSKKEEYIFGSVTNHLIREAANISVWVVA
ncbi:MAG: universal stress protein [Desulfatibacillaceae bacterium]